MKSRNPNSSFNKVKKFSKAAGPKKEGRYGKTDKFRDTEKLRDTEKFRGKDKFGRNEKPGKEDKSGGKDRPGRNDPFRSNNKSGKDDQFRQGSSYRKNEHFRNNTHSPKEDLNEDWEEQELNKQIPEESPVFSSILFKHASIKNAGDPDSNSTAGIEPLVHLSYNDELKFKNEALSEFWKLKSLPEKPEKIVASPKERHYRTTTKRRVVAKEGKFKLTFFEDDKNNTASLFTQSELETEEHNIIYRFLLEKINQPAYRIIGSNLNYLIIRGSYSEFTVIFNVHALTGAIVNKIKLLSDKLKELKTKVVSVFIYLDPSRSDYYLEAVRPQDQLSFKKLYGPDKLFIKTLERKLSFYPTAFSQVNESMIPLMIENVKKMLLPAGAERFIDLYCGYGLFSHLLADNFRETIGIDSAGPSIKSAIENSAFLAHKSKVKFYPKRITPETLLVILPEEGDMEEVFLLDPPRQGTESGVIKSIAERNPLKVIHIFCGIDQIPPELKQWKRNGYIVEKIIPLDMFPGTPNLEILISLTQRK